MLLKLPNGTIRFDADPNAVVILAIPKHLNVTRVVAYPGDLHQPVTVGRDDTVIATTALKALIEKYSAHTTNERLFLAAAVSLTPKKNDTVQCTAVRAVLEEAGFTQLRTPSTTLGALVKRGFCKRTGRGAFRVTKAGRHFLKSEPRRQRSAKATRRYK